MKKKYLDLMSSLHKSTKRDYLARVNDKKFPKFKAATLAKKYDFDYWDGDRKINYGGYYYKPGYWTSVAKKMIKKYKLNSKSKILDIGCGKGFLLYELKKILASRNIYGVDISKYAIKNSHPEVKSNLILSSSTNLPFPKSYFDLVFSINTFHNLYIYDLENSIKEMNRVAKKNKYICVESYRNEKEKANLLYWQVTCESFFTPNEWLWFFKKNEFKGNYSFIYFE
jgi:protein-L-isoaspartate(D-aspartate) O-methyltransferase